MLGVNSIFGGTAFSGKNQNVLLHLVSKVPVHFVDNPIASDTKETILYHIISYYVQHVSRFFNTRLSVDTEDVTVVAPQGVAGSEERAAF